MANQSDQSASALQAVSNALIRLHKEQFGRGPMNARAFFAGPDALVCVMEDSLLPAERKMVELGSAGRVRDSRVAFQAATQDEFVSAVEEILGRRVHSFASAVDPSTGAVFENFVFEARDGDRPPRSYGGEARRARLRILTCSDFGLVLNASPSSAMKRGPGLCIETASARLQSRGMSSVAGPGLRRLMRVTHDTDNGHGRPDGVLERFRVDVTPGRDLVCVCPSGEVDLSTVGPLRERVHELVSAGFGRVVVDLRGVTFLDSTGLRLLLELHGASRSDGWQLGILEGSAEVRRVFEITGTRAALPFVAVDEIRNSRWRSQDE